MMRPGVPMRMSMPLRSARCCGGYGVPPAISLSTGMNSGTFCSPGASVFTSPFHFLYTIFEEVLFESLHT